MAPKENTPEDIKQAIENLLHVVARHKDAVIVGYIFCNEPIYITLMSNVKEGEFNKTLEGIHNLAKSKVAQGLVIKNEIKQVA